MEISLPYETFIELELPISYVEANGNYYLFSSEEDIKYSCVVSNPTDQTDFEDNYKNESTSLT